MTYLILHFETDFGQASEHHAAEVLSLSKLAVKLAWSDSTGHHSAWFPFPGQGEKPLPFGRAWTSLPHGAHAKRDQAEIRAVLGATLPHLEAAR